MLNPTYALVSSLIWAVSPVYYRVFMNRFDFLVLNLTRTSLASAVLALPALYYGFDAGMYYALMSGAVTLAVGDTLYLLTIREMGASVATPVVYTYVLLVQLTATTVGEVVPFANVVAAVLVVVGIFVLSKGEGRPRAKGIGLGLAAAAAWTVGQDFIRLATDAGGNPFVVAFGRNIAAALALGFAVAATGRFRLWPSDLSKRDIGFLAAIAVSDLVVGSLLFVYSVSFIGVAVTVILTSLTPLLTQLISRALGKETPSRRDYLGGVLIVSAVVLASAF